MSLLMQHPWIAIVLGTVLVAVGGLVATWGWNRTSELEQRSNLVIAAVREWQFNDRMASEAVSLARRWNDRAEGENFSYQSFKAFRLNAFISSGFFGEGEKPVFDAAREYETSIGDFNAGLRIAERFNPGLFINTRFIHDKLDLPDDEKELCSETFHRLLVAHRRFGGVLQDSAE